MEYIQQFLLWPTLYHAFFPKQRVRIVTEKEKFSSHEVYILVVEGK